VAGAALVWACGGDGAVPAPKSDSQFDDGEDPGGGPPNVGTRPDASGDAQGRTCVADRDCPASHRCSYAIATGCLAAGTGVCMIYTPPADCMTTVACSCDPTPKDVPLCTPPGFAPVPVSHVGSCKPDASVPDTSVPDDASDGATSDATSDATAD